MKAATHTDNLHGKGKAISIHAAREGGDAKETGIITLICGFQSTPPVKAATSCGAGNRSAMKISIHAAREGGDQFGYLFVVIIHHFNPRRP